jgi:hypothetical protein
MAARQTALMNNMKRMRGRNHRHGGGGGGGGGGGSYRHGGHQPTNRNHVFDSNGPDMRLRGTAQQLFEKYLQLGRDATGAGDRVTAEGYFQHAEHYFRILNAMSQAQRGQQQPQQNQRRYQNTPDPADDGPDGMGDQPDTPAQTNGGGQGNGAHLNGHATGPDADGDTTPPAESREPA